jgi:hypothetical protein
LAGRRRLVKSALSAPVVLGSLASKPVLGAVPAYCTVSGQVSGNLSREVIADNCKLGDGPATWRSATSWPNGFTKGTLPNNGCSFTANGLLAGTFFNGYTPGGAVPALINAFFRSSGAGACSVVLSGSNKATMLQVLYVPTIDTEQYRLGRVVVASLLNAAQLGAEYPVSTHTIIAMFNSTFAGGSYPVTSTQSWTRSRVIEYLEGLFKSA